MRANRDTRLLGGAPARFLAVLLAATMAGGNCYAAARRTPASIPEQIRAVPPGGAVEVRLHSGPKMRGWISDVSTSQFVLTREYKNRLEKKQIGFDDVRSVKQVKSVKPSHTLRNVLIGVGIGVGVIAGVLAAVFYSGVGW